MNEAEVVRLINQLWSMERMQLLAVAALPLLFAITLHEVAHGWVARMRGDRTAEMLGRLSLNPIRHIDPVGTILVPGVMLLTAGFIFGWAKPVPVTVENLKRRHKDMAIVGAAGPLSNLAMAAVWAIVMLVAQWVYTMSPGAGQFLFFMGVAGVFLNLVLGVLNLVPIPPLDGGRVVSALLPGRLSWQYDRLEPFGVWIVLGLLLIGWLWALIMPVVIFFSGLLFGAVT